jgi:hypothetical protein
MTRTKLGLLGLCAVVVGMMAMSASAAQGATLSWLILDSTHTTATNLKAELAGKIDTKHLVLHAELAGLPILLLCTNFVLVGVFIEPVEKLNEGGKVSFTGCKVLNNKEEEAYKCTVKTAGAAAGTIETGEAKGLLELIGGVVKTKIEPKTGPTGTFAAIRFEGSECVIPEINQVHGTIVLEDCLGDPTTHLLEHLLQADPVNTLLYVGGHSLKQLEITKLLGSIWVFLAGAHKGLFWSAMDV